MQRTAMIAILALTLVCTIDLVPSSAQVNFGSVPRKSPSVLGYNRLPKFNTPPRYNPAPAYNSIRKYNSVPDYRYVPEYNSLQRFNQVSVYLSIPSYLIYPKYNEPPEYNSLPNRSRFEPAYRRSSRAITSRVVSDVPTNRSRSVSRTTLSSASSTMGFYGLQNSSTTTKLRSLDIGRIAQGQEIERSWVIRRPDAFKISSINNLNQRLKFSFSSDLKTFHVIKYHLDTSQPALIEDTIVVETNIPGFKLKREFKAEIVATRSLEADNSRLQESNREE